MKEKLKQKRNIDELISVVIPIYNVEDYLNDCLESVVNQSYKNLEIILVNDGSTDNSYRIIERFKNKDSRIKVINKSNGGLSDARNVGMKKSSGELIYFFDSDDILAPSTVEILYNELIKRNIDVIQCDIQKFYKDSELEILFEKSINQENSYRKSVFNTESAILNIIETDGLLTVNTVNKLYKKSLFMDNNIEFPIAKINEDNFTTYRILLSSNEVAHISYTGVYHRQRQGSIMNSPFSNKREDMISAANSMKTDVLSIYPQHEDRLNYNVFLAQISYLNLLATSPNRFDYESEYETIRADMNSQISIIPNNQFRKIDKLNIFSVNRGLKFHTVFRNTVNKVKKQIN